MLVKRNPWPVRHHQGHIGLNPAAHPKKHGGPAEK